MQGLCDIYLFPSAFPRRPFFIWVEIRSTEDFDGSYTVMPKKKHSRTLFVRQ